jgi:ubiquinone/menaquinone biosynthesis C-methylase UbiE
MRVLALCCGTGPEAVLAAEAVGPEGLVVGIDVNREALGLFEERAKLHGLDNVKILPGDARGLPGNLREFERITCAFGLHLLEDSGSVVDDWGDRLAPGGVLGLADWMQMGPDQVMEPVRQLVRERTGVPAIFEENEDAIQAMPARMGCQLSPAAWSSIEEETLEYAVVYPSPRYFWDVQRNNPEWQRVRDRMGPERFRTLQGEVLALLREKGGSPFEQLCRIKLRYGHRAR